jgi:cyclopropane fatty-acyl-phospholipid synthase-like methyltransferase
VKLDRIIELLDVERGQNILEIGFGWGPLAERLVSGRNARKCYGGCRVGY